jgi:membrane protease YdiL (CAAX protease family)
MSENNSIESQQSRLYSFSLNKPWIVVIILFLLICLFKYIDTFALRLDEKIGEAILTKSLGLLLVFLYLWAIGKRVSDIGFHTRYLGISLSLSGLGFIVLYAAAYLAQLLVFRAGGQDVSIALTAIDPKTGMTGGALFGLWMILANLVNSGMEEGLFRGVMIKTLLGKTSRWATLLITSGLFAIWHLGWPLRHYLDGAATLGEAAFEAAGLLLSTFIAGIVYGYLYLRTDNMWGPFLAHTINNSLLNILYYQTDSGLRAATENGVFLAVFLLGYLALLPVIKVIADRAGTPKVNAWSES